MLVANLLFYFFYNSIFPSPSLVYSVKSIYNEHPSGNFREEMQINLSHRNRKSFMKQKRTYHGLIDDNNLKMLEEKRDIFFILSFILHNTKPVEHQVCLQFINQYLAVLPVLSDVLGCV